MKKKEPSALSRLLSYAGSFRKLTYQSLLLAGLSSILSLMPFVYIWRIIKEVLEVQPDFSKATGIVHNGWMAVLFAVLSWLVYIAAMVCSHGGAFKTASNMKDAPIIILDEATANVDPESEAELTAAIEELTKEKTIIMIAHRLKTVRHADQIFVVDNGKIVQHGTHRELISQSGIYKTFVEGRREAASWKLSQASA